ncbi:hypothetical protein KFL_002200170 [Klebsormidium nitens]|uniref:MYND-type domain-containing protein n=1 Tax=Klebsormidium nitens TaxID=105231 RepID=A0A1Y1I599_KLENI|nr:hypothetical protein KFL_002200170 [Klebsormidium nitens]|eukprot:GAQ85132.1 hypothetical protein KFL_002200170 [Klebsormidium nitens]
MEEIVEKCASLILAGSPGALLSAAELLEDTRNDSCGSESAKLGFSRVLQEILAYKRGAVSDHLLQQIVKFSADSNIDSELQRLYACKVLVALTESEAVAKYCAGEKQKARLLVKAFMEAQAYLLERMPDQLRGKKCIPEKYLGRQKDGDQKHVFLNLALENVKGFASFSFASKTFRLALQKAGFKGFFPSLESLLSREIFKQASLQLVEKALKHYSGLMRSFCLFEKSQNWAFNHGMIRVQASLARLVSLDGATERLIDPWMLEAIEGIPGGAGVSRTVLFRMLLAASEQGLLDLDRRIRDKRNVRATKTVREQWLELGKMRVPRGTMPLIGLVLGELASVPPFAQALFKSALGIAKNRADLEGGRTSEAPIVCSWERCDEAGSEDDAGRKFSKCAKCSLAFYCSKEHQRLHWASHKRQCGDKSQQADLHHITKVDEEIGNEPE